MRIACLHTACSNLQVFEEAAGALGLLPGTLQHEVRADLLASAEAAGGLTPSIAHRTGAALLALCQRADAVVLSCSTLGTAVDTIRSQAQVPVLRADSALAQSAVRLGGKVTVLCAAQSTIHTTTELFSLAAKEPYANVQMLEVQLVPQAWALFQGGDYQAYLLAIAQAADRACAQGASVVALAQASMAGAIALARQPARLLSSPGSCLSAAMAAIIAPVRRLD